MGTHSKSSRTLVILCLLAVLVAIGIPAAVHIKKSFDRVRFEVMLNSQHASAHRISSALGLYILRHDRLPPAYQVDPVSSARASWRVLVDKELCGADGYVFSEPWDSQQNLRFASDLPCFLFDPCERVSPRDDGVPGTAFFAVVGQETVFAGDQGFAVKDIADGPENTVAVIEVFKSHRAWIEPEDLRYAKWAECKKTFTFEDDVAKGFAGYPTQHLIFADAAYTFLLQPLPEEVFKGLLTPAGGESISREKLIEDGYMAGPYALFDPSR